MTTHPSLISIYRPHSMESFCMDPIVKTAILSLMHIDEMNLLLVGGSCCGKTTLLNSIAREYYALDKSQSLPDNNIMFINNLKEQGIAFYRNEMKTFCQSRSSISGKKKLVIIDDIDMINEQSQQIFRTYIDKYKYNVHFISACANLQKVIESIQSRLHVIRIRHPTPSQISTLVDTIICKESLCIDPESRDFLCTYCKYSIRLIINYLEKIKILGIAVTLDICKSIVSEISFAKFDEYVSSLKTGDLRIPVQILYDLHDHGYSVIDILEYIFVFVKLTDSMTDAEKYEVIPIICKYIAIFNMTHEHHIELALFTNNMLSVLRAAKN